MPKNKRDRIPEQFDSIEEAAQFWDTHDLGEYWKHTKPFKFRIQIKEAPRYVAVEEKIAQKLSRVAKKKGVSTETLVNLWVSEKLSKAG